MVPTVPRPVRGLAYGLFATAVAVLYLGTVVTGSGPHAGDLKARRNGLDPAAVSQVHADVVFLLIGLTVGMLAAVWATGAPARARRAALALLLVEVGQGVVGFVQYFTGLPAALVGVHVGGAALTLAVATWVLVGTREPAATARTSRPAPRSRRRRPRRNPGRGPRCGQGHSPSAALRRPAGGPDPPPPAGVTQDPRTDAEQRGPAGRTWPPRVLGTFSCPQGAGVSGGAAGAPLAAATTMVDAAATGTARPASAGTAPPTAAVPTARTRGLDRRPGHHDRRTRGGHVPDGLVSGLDVDRGRGDLRQLVQLGDIAPLVRLDQRDDGAGGAGAGGTAGAVQVVLVVVRRVVVHDQVDVVDVDAAGGDVGGDEHPGAPGGERVERPLARLLPEVAVDGRRRRRRRGRAAWPAGRRRAWCGRRTASGPGGPRSRRRRRPCRRARSVKTRWSIGSTGASAGATACAAGSVR